MGKFEKGLLILNTSHQKGRDLKGIEKGFKGGFNGDNW